MNRLAKKLTIKAIPYYTILPLLACTLHCIIGDRKFSTVMTFCYLVFVEFFVFIDHYYFLHKWHSTKHHIKHTIHHQFRKHEDISAWVAFAFYPLDGLSQGMPLVYAAVLIPVSWKVVYFAILFVGVWTIYIHTNSFSLPFPFMGCDYHLIHHEKNWFNFGLFTVFFDTLWGTISHPKHKRIQMGLNR